MDKLKVLVISRQAFFRQGVWHSLSENDDMEVAAVAGVDRAVLAEVDEQPPDISIVDVDGSSEEGLDMARRLKQRLPEMGLILLSSNHNDNDLFQALKVQAAAYMDKATSPEDLTSTVRCVARGESPINESFSSRQEVAMQVLRRFQELSARAETEPVSPLTTRETEILNHIAQGMLNKQIATELGISEQTIKNHVTSILRKLNANARTEAVVLAIKQGLITIS
jgi:DNA-binding NarL/FixJ family response regulator